MTRTRLSRRTMLTGTTALATLVAASREPLAQQTVSRSAAAPGAPLPPRREFVISGANVLSMDPNIGDFAAGDVIRADVDELGYFPVSFRLGQLFTPEDSYRSVLLGLAEALSAGVTTVHNWAHNVRSPDHADAELSAMRDAGIRGRFAYGPAQGMPDDQPMDMAGLARVKRNWMPGDGLLALGICSRNIGAMSIGGATRGTLTVETAKRDWGGARALGLPITLHTSGASPIKLLEESGLLGSDVQLVHPLLTTPEERAILNARGVSYATAPVGEARRPSSVGVIQLGELLEAGVKVSLSTDHTTNYNCDPFVAMRILFALHQHRIGNKIPVTVKRLVQLATHDGAVDLGIAEKTGSLTPGKRADIILVRTSDINMAPVGDPYEALVSCGTAIGRRHVREDRRTQQNALKLNYEADARISTGHRRDTDRMQKRKSLISLALPREAREANCINGLAEGLG